MMAGTVLALGLAPESAASDTGANHMSTRSVLVRTIVYNTPPDTARPAIGIVLTAANGGDGNNGSNGDDGSGCDLVSDSTNGCDPRLKPMQSFDSGGAPPQCYYRSDVPPDVCQQP